MNAIRGPVFFPEMRTLTQAIARNRFLPVPPSERCFVGDGDFLAIGAEFLGHFVRYGRLRPDHRVLEIGCGIGRMALPLTQYLEPGMGTYDGVDIVADGIRWCSDTITPAYDAFRFHHLDLHNHLYNPKGRLASDSVRLPFPEAAFDFIFMTSVLTHLRVAETRAYAREIARMLDPGGHCFISLFLMNERSRAGLRADRRRLPFDPDAPGPEYLADPDQPAGAVAYDEAFLMELFAEAGLVPARTPDYGHWSGGEGDSYQDLLLLHKMPEDAR